MIGNIVFVMMNLHGMVIRCKEWADKCSYRWESQRWVGELDDLLQIEFTESFVLTIQFSINIDELSMLLFS